MFSCHFQFPFVIFCFTLVCNSIQLDVCRPLPIDGTFPSQFEVSTCVVARVHFLSFELLFQIIKCTLRKSIGRDFNLEENFLKGEMVTSAYNLEDLRGEVTSLICMIGNLKSDTAKER